ncbi:MAG: hypothetical protein ACSHYA_08960 [Opitutaceae bacterium]
MSFFTKTFITLSALLPISGYAMVFDLEVSVPDISTSFITTSYDATADLLTAQGSPQNLILDRSTDPIDDRRIFSGVTDFSLSVNIDVNGAIFEDNGSYGTVSVSGLLDADDSGGPTAGESYQVLLTGEITAFDGGQTLNEQGDGLATTSTLEFIFTPTGGTLIGDYTSSNDYLQNGAGIILSETAFVGDWGTNWSGGAGLADTSVLSSVTQVPEPSSGAFLAGAVAILFVSVSRRRVAI